MKRDTDVQRTIYISKELQEKLEKEMSSFSAVSLNWMIKKILTDYFRNKENKE